MLASGRPVLSRPDFSRDTMISGGTVSITPRSLGDSLRGVSSGRTGSGRLVDVNSSPDGQSGAIVTPPTVGFPYSPMPTSGGAGGGIGTGSDSGGGIATPPLRRYPGDDPLSTLADVFSSMWGGQQPAPQQQYSVVPQVLGGGGSNAPMILGVLGLAAFGIYWFYFR